jgi:hypothetical protein
MHFSARDVAEHSLTILCAYRDEIRTWLRIIMAWHSDALPMVDFRIECHENS